MPPVNVCLIEVLVTRVGWWPAPARAQTRAQVISPHDRLA
jgi:hypothetical protein